jgi:hypothetical protein
MDCERDHGCNLINSRLICAAIAAAARVTSTLSVRKATPLCYPLFSMETDWSPLTFSNRGDRRKPVPNGGGCPVFHPGEKFRRTTPKGGGHSVLSDDRRRLRKDRPFWPFHASDSETLIVRHLVAWQSPSRVNSEIFNGKILDRVGPRRDSPALPKRPPLLHPPLSLKRSATLPGFGDFRYSQAVTGDLSAFAIRHRSAKRVTLRRQYVPYRWHFTS